jgi:hypothetical protein
LPRFPASSSRRSSSSSRPRAARCSSTSSMPARAVHKGSTSSQCDCASKSGSLPPGEQLHLVVRCAVSAYRFEQDAAAACPAWLHMQSTRVQ